MAIKEGELIKYDALTEEIEINLIEDDEIREQTPTVGYYAMFEYLNGFRKAMYWSKKKMLSHADTYSKAFNAKAYQSLQEGKVKENDMWKYSSFWYKDFDGMAYKTMLRQLISKWGIMSIDMQTAMEKDMATIKENGDYEYIENQEQNYEEFIEPIQENALDFYGNEDIDENNNRTTNNITENKNTIKNENNQNIVNDVETDSNDFTNEFFS